MTVDHTMVRRASRRVRAEFKCIEAPCVTRFGGNARRKLSATSVVRLRLWAAREGWGLARRAQARVIAASLSHVSEGAIYNVLSNETWFDASYAPGQPDAEYWGALPVPVIALRMLKIG